MSPQPMRAASSSATTSAVVERRHVDLLEQAAVEIRDGFQREVAAVLHGLKQCGEAGLGFGAIGVGFVEHGFEQLLRQQAGVFGEHAEHALDQEVARFAALRPRGEAFGQLRPCLRRLLR